MKCVTHAERKTQQRHIFFIFANVMHGHYLTNALKNYLHANMLSQFHK